MGTFTYSAELRKQITRNGSKLTAQSSCQCKAQEHLYEITVERNTESSRLPWDGGGGGGGTGGHISRTQPIANP